MKLNDRLNCINKKISRDNKGWYFDVDVKEGSVLSIDAHSVDYALIEI